MMNEPNREELLLDDITFDRLVDGELSPGEYRRLLAALEQQPAAWRKCAEAFLQAQAWQQEMKEVRAAAEIKPVAKPTAEPASRSAPANDWLRMLLVAAASFLLAFFLMQTYWKVTSKYALDPTPRIVKVPVEPTAPTIAEAARNDQPLGKVQLAVNRTDNEEPEIVDVQVYDPQVATEMLSNSRPALADDLVEALEADGHRVNRRRQLVPVQLDDGRQMIVPIEGYRIVPVSRPSY
jgi:hypothetical protein